MRKIVESIHEKFSNSQEFAVWIPLFVKKLGDRDVLFISGQLGAGKTFFVSNVIRALGGDGGVSPSFAIHNRYVIGDRNLDHVDLYRLKDNEDLESTGFWDLFVEPTGLVAIEWANRLAVDDIMYGWNVWEIKIVKSTSNETAREVFVTRWSSR